MCAHSPFHRNQEKSVARWTQIHGKHCMYTVTLVDVSLGQSSCLAFSFQLICRWKCVDIGHSFAIIFFFHFLFSFCFFLFSFFCLSHTPSTCHTCTTLVFSHCRTLSHDVLHSALVSSMKVILCAQDTQQIHGKHGSGALLNPLVLLCCGALVNRASLVLLSCLLW